MPAKSVSSKSSKSSSPKVGGPAKTVSQGNQTRGGVTKTQAPANRGPSAEMKKKLDHSYAVQASIRSTDTRSAKEQGNATASFMGGVFNKQMAKNLENVAGQTTDFLRSPAGQGLLTAASFIPGVGMAARAIGVASEVGGSILDMRRGQEMGGNFQFTQDLMQRTAQRYQPQDYGYQDYGYQQQGYGYGTRPGNMNAFSSGSGFSGPQYGQQMDRNRGYDPEEMYQRNVQQIRQTAGGMRMDPRMAMGGMARGGINFRSRDPGADEYLEEAVISEKADGLFGRGSLPPRVHEMARSALGVQMRNQSTTTIPFEPDTRYRRSNPYMQLGNDSFPDDFSIQGARYVPGPGDYD